MSLMSFFYWKNNKHAFDYDNSMEWMRYLKSDGEVKGMDDIAIDKNIVKLRIKFSRYLYILLRYAQTRNKQFSNDHLRNIT